MHQVEAILYFSSATPSARPTGFDLRTIAIQKYLPTGFSIDVISLDLMAHTLRAGAKRHRPSIWTTWPPPLPFMIRRQDALAILDQIADKLVGPARIIIGSMELAPLLVPLRKRYPEARIIFDMRDRLSRQAAQKIAADKPLQNGKNFIRYILLRSWEALVYKLSNAVILLSETDRPKNSKLLPKTHFINNGLPSIRKCTPSRPGAPFTFLFLADFSYEPNRKAFDLLVREVAPYLNAETFIDVAGRGSESILANDLPRAVRIMGTVDDLNVVLESATAVVAPLQQGTGIKNKVVESMTAGRAVITTNIGNDGIGAVDSKEIFLTKDSNEILAVIERLSMDVKSRHAVEIAGRDLVVKKFNDTWNASKMAQILHVK